MVSTVLLYRPWKVVRIFTQNTLRLWYYRICRFRFQPFLFIQISAGRQFPLFINRINRPKCQMLIEISTLIQICILFLPKTREIMAESKFTFSPIIFFLFDLIYQLFLIDRSIKLFNKIHRSSKLQLVGPTQFFRLHLAFVQMIEHVLFIAVGLAIKLDKSGSGVAISNIKVETYSGLRSLRLDYLLLQMHFKLTDIYLNRIYQIYPIYYQIFHMPHDDEISLIAKDTYKSKSRIIIIALTASLSSVIQGYGIKQITSLPIETLQRNFDSQMDKNLFEGLLMGIMPLGGLLGSLLSNFFITTVTRRQGMHIVVPLLALATLLMQITTIKTLFLGRFAQGICIGYYISIAPIYLQQITPKQLKSVVGTFFGLGKIIGVLLSISLALVLGEEAWRLLLSVNLILALIQSVLLQTIGSDTPFQWIIRDNQIKAKQAVNQIYLEHKAQSILESFNNDFKLNQEKNNQKQEDLSIVKKKQTALATAVGACLSRHLTGGNALVTAAGVILAEYSEQLGKWTPITINTIQLVSLCIYMFIFAKSVGKRPVLVYSSGLLTLINTILVLSLVFSYKTGIFISVATFMMVYGILLSVTWSYPSEILPASEALLPNIMHWLALSLSTLAPFFIMAAMPNNQVYPCFIFFACYCLLSFIYYYHFAVETNGLTYQRIIVKFKEW